MIIIRDDKSIHFTRHALIRMKQRRISPTEVFRAIAHADPTLEQEQRLKVAIGKKTLMVIVHEARMRRTITSVFFKGEPDERAK